MNALQLTLQFVLSGAVVVGASLIAKSMDAKWAGLLVALPVMTILGYIFIAMNNTPEVTHRYLVSALVFMIPAAIYIGSLYVLHGKMHVAATAAISIIPLAIAVFVMQKFF